ncbi:MAG: hypothetical protein FWD68_13840 [Alphaproteobacteria bacterium]|nr:hypothetical protein [Alphaproteobacteria bacterium]
MDFAEVRGEVQVLCVSGGFGDCGSKWMPAVEWKGAMKAEGEDVECLDNLSREVIDRMEQSLIEIAVESWRLSRLFSRVVCRLDAGESDRYVSQLRYFEKRVEEALSVSRIRLVNIEGESYRPGTPALALNLGEFGPDDELRIDVMLEPIVMGPSGLRKEGTVVLRKVSI